MKAVIIFVLSLLCVIVNAEKSYQGSSDRGLESASQSYKYEESDERELKGVFGM